MRRMRVKASMIYATERFSLSFFSTVGCSRRGGSVSLFRLIQANLPTAPKEVSLQKFRAARVQSYAPKIIPLYLYPCALDYLCAPTQPQSPRHYKIKRNACNWGISFLLPFQADLTIILLTHENRERPFADMYQRCM